MQVFQNTIARPVAGVSFAPDGATLAAGGSGGYEVWNLARSTHSFIESYAVKYLFGFACDPLGRWIYVSDYLRGLRLLPLSGQKPGTPPGSKEELHVRSFDLAADGKRLVMSRGGAGTNRVECWKIQPSGAFASLWSLRDGKPVKADEPYLLNQATWTTNGVGISRDSKVVATAESRKAGSSGVGPLIVLRDGQSGKIAAELGKSKTSFDTRLLFAPDGKNVYAWDNRIVERWDIESGQLAQTRPAPGRSHYQGVAIHPSGKFIVTVSADEHARYWEPERLTPLKSAKLGIGRLYSLAISADGKLAAAGGDKGKVVVWEV